MSAPPPDAPSSAAHASTPSDEAIPTSFALLGNPNTGKTTLFNRLCGIRARTANFPGSTVEARIGRIALDHTTGRVIDLPGIYALDLDRPESRICRDVLAGDITMGRRAEALVVVIDASNLRRNLVFVRQALQQKLPTVIALNMVDLARRRGVQMDIERLNTALGCPVVPVVARSGAGVRELVAAMKRPAISDLAPDSTDDDPDAWAQRIYNDCVIDDAHRAEKGDQLTDRLDGAFTHPVLGLVIFAAVMTALFYAIFALAAVPMELIELFFGKLASLVGTVLPDGAVHDLVADGIIGGIAGTAVFLPQICLLFFLISLLEDTGYLARAAFVLDRAMRVFGLPGQAFLPMLSAHACAIPAIFSTRLIPDRRDRVAAVLVVPFMSCSARLPVYVLLVGILFTDPLHQGLAFAGCYMLGAIAAFGTALLVRRTLLRGPSPPLVIELPTYKFPSLRTALLVTIERGWLFLRKVGTIILGICIVLWWLSAYPTVPEPPAAVEMRAEAQAIVDSAPQEAAALNEQAGAIAARHALAHSFVGRIGRFAAPAFEPIGLDWQLTVGVLTSFAAREVFVSTLAVMFSGGEGAEDEAVLDRIRTARRDDGSPLLTPASAASLLVFFVLAMQCLPTLPVTAREAGHWGWALLQLGYMTAVAYLAALVVYVGFNAAGFGGA